MNIAKFLKNSFFYRSVDTFGYNNQSKIFREISASKLQGQHAAQFRYDGLCSATKTEIHRLLFLEQLLLRIISGAASGKKTEEEKDAQLPLWFQVFTFSLAYIY